MAIIPPFFLDTVVAIGERDSGGAVSFGATGFLYGLSVPSPADDPTPHFRVYLVTNRHVVSGKDTIVLRFNAVNGAPAKTFDVDLKNSSGSPQYYTHSDPDIDVAVMFLNGTVMRQQGIQFAFFESGGHVQTLTEAADAGVSEGSSLFLLGFPLGDAGKDQNFVVARQGCVARMRDAVAGVSKHFVADLAVFPGNSGGPVVTRPESLAIQGTSSQDRAYLIGIVAAYIPYSDVAISVQTKRPRVVFEENSGLAIVYPVEHIQATIGVADSVGFPVAAGGATLEDSGGAP